MRIGFLSKTDSALPDSHSGIPYAMREELARRADVKAWSPRSMQRSVRRWLSAFGLARSASKAVRSWRRRAGVIDPADDPAQSVEIEAALRATAARTSRELAEEIRRSGVDVVFTSFSSPLLYEMEIEQPIVYYSDSTMRTIRATYPYWQAKAEGFVRAYDDFERRALTRSAAVCLATNFAGRSAIEDYGVDPARLHIVPLGCNVTADAFEGSRKPPSRESFELSLVALDPARKGLDICIGTVEAMRARGVDAWLTYVGPVTAEARACPWVRCTGKLQLASRKDRQEHQRILAESHFFIMPSVAEAFGIAPAEAGQFHTPSIVRAAGGLPEVVLDGDTGIVMDFDAEAEAYAERLIAMIDDPAGYERMCDRAKDRACNELSWGAWADRVMPILESVVASAGGTESTAGSR
jgi:glycosyltransferase involved in cell wall biosynthesis